MASCFEIERLKKTDTKTQKIVFGFIHDAQKLLTNSKYNAYFLIPDIICYITLAFYYIPFTFNICSRNASKHVIKADGKLFKTFEMSKNVSAGDSNGRKSGKCMIKINKTEYSTIGITSDVNNIKHNIWSGTYPHGRTYYLHNSGHAWTVTPTKSGSTMTTQEFKCDAWKDGDIITIEWMTDGKLTYHINDIKVGEISIQKKLTHFLCVSTLAMKQVEFEIV